MQFTTTFIIAAALAFNSVNAGCYGGTEWGAEKGLAEEAVDALCDPTKLNSFIHDEFQTGQTKADCVQLSGNKKADFQVNWGGEGALSLAQGDCIQRFKDEVNGCGSGGMTTTADWTFTADPNDGTCEPVARKEKKRSAKFIA